MALSFNQATIVVRDFEAYKDFFIQLGLKLIVYAPPRYARFECPGNSATFSIEAFEDDKELRPLPLHQTAIYFELPSKQALDDYCTELEARGIKFKEKPEARDKEYLWREACLVTPENHDIRLYFAGTNRLNPPWRVN